jgi:mRNA interferase YafQ
MRAIERTSAFKKDYKRAKATPRHKNIEAILEEVVGLLFSDRELSARHSDHALAGSGTIIGNAT